VQNRKITELHDAKFNKHLLLNSPEEIDLLSLFALSANQLNEFHI